MTRQLSPFWLVVAELAVESVTQHAWPKTLEVTAGLPTLASRGLRKFDDSVGGLQGFGVGGDFDGIADRAHFQ